MSEHDQHEHHDEHGHREAHQHVHVYHHVPESLLEIGMAAVQVMSRNHNILERILNTMATQESVDAITQAIGEVSDKLDVEATETAAAAQAILDEIAGLQGQGVDTTNLEAAAARLQTSASNLTSASDAVQAIPVPPVTEPPVENPPA